MKSYSIVIKKNNELGVALYRNITSSNYAVLRNLKTIIDVIKEHKVNNHTFNYEIVNILNNAISDSKVIYNLSDDDLKKDKLLLLSEENYEVIKMWQSGEIVLNLDNDEISLNFPLFEDLNNLSEEDYPYCNISKKNNEYYFVDNGKEKVIEELEYSFDFPKNLKSCEWVDFIKCVEEIKKTGAKQILIDGHLLLDLDK